MLFPTHSLPIMNDAKPPTSGRLNRRQLMQSTAALAALAPISALLQAKRDSPLPATFDGLQPLGSRVKAITSAQYQARVARAQLLLAEQKPKLDALFIAPGTSLFYFIGVHWWPSERLLGLLIPQKGEPIVVCPAFEEARFREQLHIPAEVHVWQEDESPTKLAASALADRGLRTGRIGVEEATMFTFYDHLRQAAPAFEFTSADPVTIACRGVKSAQELELMRLACEATCDVYRAVFASLKEGMSQNDVSALVEAGYAKMGLRGDALVLFGAAAALPHGTLKPQTLREGDVVLIDDGCKVEGYSSDVTRTAVFGKPTDKIQRTLKSSGERRTPHSRPRKRKTFWNSGRRRARNHHVRRVRTGLQIFYPSPGPRDRSRRPRASLSGARKQNQSRTRYDIFQRTGRIHPRRVRHSLRRSYGRR